MHDGILIASSFPAIDLVLLVETWQKDGIGKAKVPNYSYFSSARYGTCNIHPGTTTQGEGGDRKSICTWVSHLPSTHTYMHTWNMIHKDIGLSTKICVNICYFPPSNTKTYKYTTIQL